MSVLVKKGITSVRQRMDAHPGLHISCLACLREHDVAAAAWDMLEGYPVGYAGMDFGVRLGSPFLG
jgi:hypothetical protein